MSNNANSNKHADMVLSTLKIIGGRSIDRTLSQFPDVFVKGGVRIKGGLDVCGRVVIESDLIINGELSVNGIEGENANVIVATDVCAHSAIIGNISSKGLSIGTLANVVALNSGTSWNDTSSGVGDRNQFWGFQSGQTATSLSSDNISFGYRSAYSLGGDDRNIVIGSYALKDTTNVSDNVVIGHHTFSENVSSNISENNVFIGYKVCNAYQTESLTNNVVIGSYIMNSYAGASGDNNVLLGHSVAEYASNHIGDSNIFIGKGVASNQGFNVIANGSHNISIGYDTTRAGQAGDKNVAIGSRTLTEHNVYVVSNNQIAIGSSALDGVSSSYALGIGGSVAALQDNNVTITCKYIFAIGSGAFFKPTNTAHYNTFIGHSSGAGFPSFVASVGPVTGANNTAFGSQSFKTLESGSNNAVFGYKTNVDSLGGSNQFHDENNCVIFGALSNRCDNGIILGVGTRGAPNLLSIANTTNPVGDVNTTLPSAGGQAIPTAVGFWSVRVNDTNYRIPLLNSS